MPTSDPGATPMFGGRRPPTVASLPAIPDFDLVRPIGRGAYGEVWLAHHKTLGTARALKIVRRADFDDDRPFRREFEGIRHYEPISRGHPNLVAVLHVGGDPAAFYYVMELADPVDPRDPPDQARGTFPASLPLSGEPATYAPRTLRADLKVRGHLSADESVRSGRGLAGALAHLHARALVHRDVKPSNVIFVDGVLKLADIGLVTDISDSRSFVGTEGYMPPEGPGTTSADCYALGKVLYELSTGRDRRDYPDPPPDLLTRSDRERLLELNAVLHRACAPDPRQRYPDARAMVADLDRLEAGLSVRAQHAAERRWAWVRRHATPIAGIALVAVLSLAALKSGSRPHEAQPSTAAVAPHSFFVLPFRNAGTNAADRDLCGRVTDAFIDSLGLVPGVAVGPRKSGWVALDEEELRRSLARTNAMRHVLTGRVAVEGEMLSLGLRLFENGADQPLWTETFTGSTNQLIESERRGLAGVLARFEVAIPEETQRRMDLLLTNNLEALGLARRAASQYYARGDTQLAFTEGMRLVQRALALDPGYLDADYSDAYFLRCVAMDRAPVEVWPSVRRRVDAILERDDTHTDALNQLGGYLLFFDHDWRAFDACHEREIAWRSGRDWHFIRAWWLRISGRLEEARREQRLAEDPEPMDYARAFMCSSRWVHREYDAAIQVARRTLGLFPGNADGYYWLAHCLVAKGDYAQGIAAIADSQAVNERQELTALLAVAHARQGERAKAEAVLPELLGQQRSRPYLNPYFVARVYAALGEKELAMDWLQRAIDDRCEHLFVPDWGGLRSDWAWDGLQKEPRYWQLCEQLGMGKDEWPR
jgi:TolB-like protein